MRGGACAGSPLRASKARHWLAREDVQKMCSQADWKSATAKMRSNITRRAACNWARVLGGAARHGSLQLHFKDRRDERNEEENRTLEAEDHLDSRSGSRPPGSGCGRSPTSPCATHDGSGPTLRGDRMTLLSPNEELIPRSFLFWLKPVGHDRRTRQRWAHNWLVDTSSLSFVGSSYQADACVG